jgi:spore coat protein U-like protein
VRNAAVNWRRRQGKQLLLWAALAAGQWAALAAAAGNASPALSQSVCRISNVMPLEFEAAYDPFIGRPTDGRASFTVTCNHVATVTLSLLYSHRLIGASGGLHYDLSATPDRITVWGNGSDGATVTRAFPAGIPTVVQVYARIPARQRAAPGRLHDSLVVVPVE